MQFTFRSWGFQCSLLANMITTKLEVSAWRLASIFGCLTKFDETRLNIVLYTVNPKAFGKEQMGHIS